MDFIVVLFTFTNLVTWKKLQTRFRDSRAQKKIINYSKLNKEQNREFLEILTSGVIPTSPITCPLHHQDHRNQCQFVHQVNISLKSQFPI